MQESADLFGEKERYVKGLVKVVIFHNEQNLYSVLKVRVHETSEDIEDKEITVTGYFPSCMKMIPTLFWVVYKSP